MAGQIALTERELEILRLVAWSNKEIALLLCVRPKTVKNMLTSINRKVLSSNVTAKHTRVPLLLTALRSGILHLDDVSLGPIRF